MAKTPKKSSGITFDKIMLTLFVLGIFAVIGILVMMYQTVIRTPEITQNNMRITPTVASEPICLDVQGEECNANTTQSASQAAKPVAEKEKNQADSETDTVSNPNEVAQDAIPVAPEPTTKKSTVKKELKPNTTVTTDNETTGGQELKPINSTPQGTTPKKAPIEKNDTHEYERELRPTNPPPRERPIKPEPEKSNDANPLNDLL